MTELDADLPGFVWALSSIAWTASAVLSGWLARGRGRSALLWGAFALLFAGPFGCLVALLPARGDAIGTAPAHPLPVVIVAYALLVTLWCMPLIGIGWAIMQGGPGA